MQRDLNFQDDHKNLMLSILKNVSDTPLTLIGGTALFLCYGLDRFSVDIDFDTNKKINLINKIQKSLPPKFKLIENGIVHFKNTEVNSKYKINYVNSLGYENTLLIDIKIKKDAIIESQIIDGIRVAPIHKLLENKINCIQNRTAARDIFDLNFLINKYPQHFNKNHADLLANNFSKDKLKGIYADSWEEDELLKQYDLNTMIDNFYKKVSILFINNNAQ